MPSVEQKQPPYQSFLLGVAGVVILMLLSLVGWYNSSWMSSIQGQVKNATERVTNVEQSVASLQSAQILMLENQRAMAIQQEKILDKLEALRRVK